MVASLHTLQLKMVLFTHLCMAFEGTVFDLAVNRYNLAFRESIDVSVDEALQITAAYWISSMKARLELTWLCEKLRSYSTVRSFHSH
jgi:hypothetical protein